MALFIPDRKLRQPRLAARLNRKTGYGKLVTAGIAAHYQNGYRELVGGELGTAISTIPKLSIASGGRGVQAAASNSGMKWTNSDRWAPINGGLVGFSVELLFTITGSNAQFDRIFDNAHGGGSWDVEFDSPTSSLSAVLWDTGSFYVRNIATGLSVGQTCHCVFTFYPGTRDLIGYQNGVTTGTTTLALSSVSTDQPKLFTYVNTGSNTAQGVALHFLLVYNSTVLSASQVRERYNNLYGIFRVPNRLTGKPSAGTIYAVSISESGSATDTPSARVDFVVSDSESASAVDTPSSIATFGATEAESASAADAASSVATLAASAAEGATATDSPSSVATLIASDSESASAADTQNTTGAVNVSISESAGAADTPSSVATLPSTASENAAASDTPSSAGSLPGSASETATISDTVSALVSSADRVSESLAALSAQSAQADLVAAEAEAAAALDVESAGLSFAESVTEAVNATDFYIAVGNSEVDPRYIIHTSKRDRVISTISPIRVIVTGKRKRIIPTSVKG